MICEKHKNHSVAGKKSLRSMIPYHASTILMCEQTSAQRQEIKDLSKDIISNQQVELDQMKALLRAFDK